MRRRNLVDLQIFDLVITLNAVMMNDASDSEVICRVIRTSLQPKKSLF